MGDRSEIQWTNATWNPVTGCSKVSPGCAHCYAETLTMRHHAAWGVPKLPWTPQNMEVNVRLHPERLDQPLRWQRPRLVFVNSMSDMFHEMVPETFIADVFAAMALSEQHTFQCLTKRPDRMLALLGKESFRAEVAARAWSMPGRPALRRKMTLRQEGLGDAISTWPLPNVWMGVSIENKRWVGRADQLRETPAAVRFISAEPLLGPLIPPLGPDGAPEWRGLDLTGIDWVIAGGESGAGHRLVKPEWIVNLRDACLETQGLCPHCDHGIAGGAPCGAEGCRDGRRAGTAFFFKQWGGQTPKSNGRELAGRTWDEMPAVR